MSKQNIIYVFLDEGGNFDFSEKGTKFFSLTSVSMKRPFPLHSSLDSYKYDLLEYGLDTEYFHCTNDNTHVRNKVFEILKEQVDSFRIDSLVIEKPKTGFSLQKPEKFYPKMLGYLLRYVIEAYNATQIDEIIVITDQIPINKKRNAIEKSIKKILSELLPNDVQYKLFHHSSKAHHGLQIADYCNWAIFRKWERIDTEYYDLIKTAIKSEYDIFQAGSRRYY